MPIQDNEKKSFNPLNLVSSNLPYKQSIFEGITTIPFRSTTKDGKIKIGVGQSSKSKLGFGAQILFK